MQATTAERGMLYREGKADLLSHNAKHMPQNDPNEGGRELGIYTPSLSLEVALPHFVSGDVCSYLSAGLGRRSLSHDADAGSWKSWEHTDRFEG